LGLFECEEITPLLRFSMGTTTELEYWYDSNCMEANKKSTKYTRVNQSKQQEHFTDSCCHPGGCFSTQTNSSVSIPEMAAGSRCHCRFMIMEQ
jgi:hypothetical protein